MQWTATLPERLRKSDEIPLRSLAKICARIVRSSKRIQKTYEASSVDLSVEKTAPQSLDTGHSGPASTLLAMNSQMA